MSWPIVALGDVCEVTMGQAPPGTSYNEEGVGSPLIAGAGDFENGVANPTKYTTSPSKLSAKGDVILGIRATIGVKVLSDREYCLGRGVAGLRPKPPLDSRYLWQWLSYAESSLNAKGRGATFRQVNRSDITSMEVPLPPLPEQRRIAAILDHADALRAKRHETIALQRELSRAVYVGLFGCYLQFGENVTLGDVLTSIDSGRSPHCLGRPAFEGERGVLKLSAVTSGTYLPTENKALPSDQGFNPAHEVRPGDLLFTRKNTTELVAACAYVRETPPGMLLPDLIYRLNLREDSGLTPRFVQQTLMYPEVRKRVQRLAGGSAGSMPNISKAKLATVRIPRPPYEVQLEFDRRLDKLDMLMLEVEKNGYALDFLCSSLQSRAFRGEL